MSLTQWGFVFADCVAVMESCPSTKGFVLDFLARLLKPVAGLD